MLRGVAVAGLLAILLGVAGLSRATLEEQGADAVPAGLLYLPEGPYLRALALGHEETLADLLYIWAIQYYSNYDDASRYEYLTKVFGGAITELDPLFIEPYYIGALIMSLEARRPDEALALFDKGLAVRPDQWELAYWAGWESYLAGDYLRAREYWLKAQNVDGSPNWIQRLSARMLERAGDLDAALEEYRRLYETAEDERTRLVAQNWLDHALKDVALRTVEKALAAYRAEHGRCPGAIIALAGRPEMANMPPEIGPEDLRYDPDTCEVLPAPGLSIGKQR